MENTLAAAASIRAEQGAARAAAKFRAGQGSEKAAAQFFRTRAGKSGGKFACQATTRASKEIQETQRGCKKEPSKTQMRYVVPAWLNGSAEIRCCACVAHASRGEAAPITATKSSQGTAGDMALDLAGDMDETKVINKKGDRELNFNFCWVELFSEMFLVSKELEQ